jgi:hypothetical protein
MLCFKVSINGRVACVAGMDAEDSLTISIRQSERETPHIVVGGRKRRNTMQHEKTYVFGTQNLELHDSVTVELVEGEEADQPIEIHTEELRRRLDLLGGPLPTYTWDKLSALLHESKPISLQPRELLAEELAAHTSKPAEGSSSGPVAHGEDEAKASPDSGSTDRNIEDQDAEETAGNRSSESKSKHLHLVSPKPKHLSHCSFCDRSQRDIVQLIVGPGVSICDQCADLCQQIIAERVQGSGAERSDDGHAGDDAAALKWGLWPRNQA